jgi:hypothetical protein
MPEDRTHPDDDIDDNTPAQSVSRYGWEDKFFLVLRQVVDRHTAVFSDAVFNPEQDRPSARIRFKGAVPEGVEELTRTLPHPVDLVGHAPYSEADRALLRATAWEALLERLGTPVPMGGGFDGDTYEAVLYPGPDATRRVPPVDELRACVEAAVRRRHPDLPAPEIIVRLGSGRGPVAV